jgi:hypothetical protein
MESCNRGFYSLRRIVRRVANNFWQRRQPLVTLVSNLSCRNNIRLNKKVYREFNLLCGESRLKGPISPTGENLHVLAPAEPLPSLAFAPRRRVGSEV